MDKLSKYEVRDLVSGWIDAGLLAQKSSIIGGGTWYSAWKLVEDGKLFFTDNDRVVATDREVRDQFQALLRSGRVMSLTGVTIRHPECATAHSVAKLVAQGDILKIGGLRSVKLYAE